MIGILIPVLIGLAFVGGLIIYTFNRKQVTKRILDSLDTANLKRIDINYSASSTSNFRVVCGMTNKSYLYLSEKYFLITHRNNSLFSFPSYTLPIVITGNVSETKEVFKLRNVTILKPDSIKITNWNSINIKWEEKTPIVIKHEISIKLENKSEIEYFKKIEIENWC